MDDLDTPSILAVGARLANLARARSTGEVDSMRASVTEVATGRQALALLRVIPFDIVAIGPAVEDMPANQFAQTLRRAKPWQKWVSVTDDGSDAHEEIAARTLGALAVVDGPAAWPQIVEIAQRVRRHNPASVVSGMSISGGRTQRADAGSMGPALGSVR